MQGASMTSEGTSASDVKPSTIARYSVGLFALLVVYASLYPFTGWRAQGEDLFAFVTAPLPRFLTAQDVWLNVLGYMPLGFLGAAALWPRTRGLRAWALTFACCSLLSLSMETLQTFLPERVASNVDWGLNSLGAAIGAALALLSLPRLPAASALYALRKRWFAPDASFGLWLLVVWPLALLTPQPLLFGMGNALSAAAAWAAAQLQGSAGFTPIAAWLAGWQPAGLSEPQQQAVPLLATLSAILTLASLTARGLPYRVRALLACALLALGCAATTLSQAMSYGPTHAFSWLNAQNIVPLLAGLALGLLLLRLPGRWSTVLALLCTVVSISLVNQAQEDFYFALNLQSWQQGRWIRLHGIAQWIAMLWPWVLAAHLLSRLAAAPHEAKP
jgi:VanZ family protein